MIRLFVLLLLGCFLTASHLVAEPNEIVETIVTPPGDPNAKIITKKDVVRDRKGTLLRIVNYLTEKYTSENGFSIQIDQYDGNKFPSQFIMIFTESVKKTTGFSKRIDHVTQKDELIEADFFVDDKYAFTAAKEDLDAFDKYPPHRMGKYYEDYHEDGLRKDHYNIETPVFGGTAFTRFSNRQKEIGPQEKYLIAAWSKLHGADGFIAVYNKAILVKEGEHDIWVCFQDELLKYLSPDLNMVIRYYYIGESVEGMTYLATFMKEINEVSSSKKR